MDSRESYYHNGSDLLELGDHWDADQSEKRFAPELEYAVQPTSTKRFRLEGAQAASADERLRTEFGRLAKRWKADTFLSSSSHALYFHPAYQRIIGMGRDALPFILEDLAVQDADWFWALKCITGADPVPKSAWGDFAKAKRAWLRWADKNVGQ